MTENALLLAPVSDAEVVQSTRAVAERRMLVPAQKAGYELQFAGATLLPEKRTISRTQWGTWLFDDHLEDPTAAQYSGRIPIPEEQVDRLLNLARHDVSPQLVWLAHQLPDSYQDGDPLPPLVPAPRHLREKDERLTLYLAKAAKLFGQAVGSTLAVAASPLAILGVGLDPIVLGGVKHPELPVVGWCVLAQWEWE